MRFDRPVRHDRLLAPDSSTDSGRRHAVCIVRARDEKRVPEDRGAELQRSRNVFDSRYNVRSNRVE